MDLNLEQGLVGRELSCRPNLNHAYTMCFGGSHQIWKLGMAQTSHPNIVGIRVFTSTLDLTACVQIILYG